MKIGSIGLLDEAAARRKGGTLGLAPHGKMAALVKPAIILSNEKNLTASLTKNLEAYRRFVQRRDLAPRTVVTYV